MAIGIGVQIVFEVVGDGSQTVFTLDLLKQPYGFELPASTTPTVWFSDDRKATSPVSAFAPAGEPYSASLSDTVVTVTFSTAPPVNALTQANVNLIF
jgi:hypothetical protein